MAAAPEIPRPTSESNEAEAAIQALLCFAKSTEDVLKYQPIYAEGAQAKKALRDKEAEARAKDDRIKELESAISVWTRRGNEEVRKAESEKAALSARLQLVLREKAAIEVKAKDTESLLNTRTKYLNQLQKEVHDLKAKEEKLNTAYRKESIAKKEIAAELDKIRVELHEYAGYTENLIDLDMVKFFKLAARIQERTNTLVEKFFSLEISSELFEVHDKWIQHACNLLRPPSGSILIPPTNSPAAKCTRKAVMMSVLAQMLTQWIFTATPLPLAQAGLDDILSTLTDEDDKKELLCRAILNSVSNQKNIEYSELAQLLKWFSETFGSLLPPKARTELKSDIRKLLTEASEWWDQSRHSRDKIIATLDYESYPDSWKNHPAPRHPRRRDSKHAEASDPEDEEEIAFVSFPAIVTLKDGEWEPIHRGSLVRYSHVREAEDEWRTQRGKRRFSRSGVPNSLAGLLPSRVPRGVMSDSTN